MSLLGQPVWDISISRNNHESLDLECEGPVCIASLAEGFYYNSYVLRSSDFGKTWERVFEDTVADGRYVKPIRGTDVEFLNPDDILIAGDSAKVLRSSDAGLTWEVYDVGSFRWGDGGNLSMADSLNGILTVETYLIWAIDAPDSLYQTSDGGYSWRTVPVQPREPYRIREADIVDVASPAVDQYLVLFTHPDYYKDTVTSEPVDDSVMVFAYSENGGRSWSYHELKVEGVRYIRSPSLTFFDPQNGIMTGITSTGHSFGIVAVTSDGGRTWGVRMKGVDSTNRSNGIIQSQFDSSGKGFAAYAAGVGRSTDGGLTWQRDSIPPLPDIGRQKIIRVHFWDDSTGVAMTDAGAFYYLDRNRTGVADGDRPRRAWSTASLIWHPGGEEVLTISSDRRGEALVRLYDVTGKLLREASEEMTGGTLDIRLPVGPLSSGYYLLQILLPDGTEQTCRVLVR